MSQEGLNPRVGVGVFIFKAGKFLMGRRRGAHGAGAWSIPGGHLEWGETPEQTAIREVKEETGLEIDNVALAAVTNDIFREENKHYVTLWMRSDWVSGEPEIVEPDKFIDQDWFDFDNLPKPLFLPWEQLLKSQFMDGLRLSVAKTRK